MLDPRLLRAFVAIADAGSFTAAADRLHMTQSTMSQQIARLEEAIGRELVDRMMSAHLERDGLVLLVAHQSHGVAGGLTRRLELG